VKDASDKNNEKTGKDFIGSPSADMARILFLKPAVSLCGIRTLTSTMENLYGIA